MKKKNNKTTLPKYEFGSRIESPYQALVENDLSLARANNKANNNSWTQGLDLFGNIALQAGSSIANKGLNSGVPTEDLNSTGTTIENALIQNKNLTQTGLGALGIFSNLFQMGGMTQGNSAINAEGGEMIQTPEGLLGELKGPSHSNGGIDMLVPDGTEIFSKKLKGPDGKTMAERKKTRENNLKKLEKQLEKNPTDKALLKALERTKENNERVEAEDMQKMQMAKLMQDSQKMFALGGIVNKKNPLLQYVDVGIEPAGLESFENILPTASTVIPTALPQANSKSNTLNGVFDNINLTSGDIIGLGGQLYSTFAPMKNTQTNRAGDTPNINAFENFGKDALNILQNSKGYVAGQKDEALRDLNLQRNAAASRNRNSARGINTLRALDTATESVINDSRRNIYNDYTKMMQGILGQEAQLENIQDQMVMQGEAARDLADRQDRDAYFSQLARDIATKGEGIQRIGKNINQVKDRNVKGNVINQLYPNFNVDAYSGNISFLPDDVIESSFKWNKIPSKSRKLFNDLEMQGKIKFNTDLQAFVDRNGNVVDINNVNKVK